MILLGIKPISVNEAYKGRRFSTSKLLKFKKDIFKILPKIDVPEGKLEVKYVFGVSSKGSDGDNLVKAFQDCLSEAYRFNDNKIYKWNFEKVDVKKGEEFIEFEILSYPQIEKLQEII